MAAALYPPLPSTVCMRAIDHSKGTNLSNTQERGKSLCECQIKNSFALIQTIIGNNSNY